MSDALPTILVVHVAPPEHTVVTWLRHNIPLAGLRGRNIDAPVVHGHPLFVEGVSEKGADSAFPKIGVEWTTDKRTDSIGGNFRRFKPSAQFKAALNNYVFSLPTQERAASDLAAQSLGQADVVESWTHIVRSEVIIAGFTSGGTGRSDLRFIYETVDCLMAAMAQDIAAAFPGVKVDISEVHEVNITSEVGSGKVWGFEIPIGITQPRRIFRKKPKHAFPDIETFDIHMSGSRTVFKTKDLFDFETGFSTVEGESDGK
ncbi:MAG: hypothetical protein KDK37_05895 [Leptospiraceae bacterium]|nr:hypothetical protein [Leptospiraceae bacterium]